MFCKNVTEQKVKFPMKFLTFFEVQKEKIIICYLFLHLQITSSTLYVIHEISWQKKTKELHSIVL